MLLSLTHVGFALAESLVAFVALYTFRGVAATFRSGSLDVWLYDTLTEQNADDTYTKVRGRATGAFYVSAATTALIGGVLYETRPSLPFPAAAGSTALHAVVVVTLPEPDVIKESDGFSFSLGACSTLIHLIEPTDRYIRIAVSCRSRGSRDHRVIRPANLAETIAGGS